MYNVTKMLFFYFRFVKKSWKSQVQTKIKQYNDFNVDNNQKCFLMLQQNQEIRINFEGLCDNEDWNNGCWKLSFLFFLIFF